MSDNLRASARLGNNAPPLLIKMDCVRCGKEFVPHSRKELIARKCGVCVRKRDRAKS